MNCDCPSCRRPITYTEQDAGCVEVCPHCSVRMILPELSGPPTARLLRRPPKPPVFGIKIHPLVAMGVLLLLVAVGFLIAFASDPNFLPAWNPFASSLPAELQPTH